MIKRMLKKVLKNSLRSVNSIGLTISLSIILFSSCKENQENKERVLPFLGNYDIEYNLVDGVEIADTLYSTIPFFHYLNEDSVRIKSTDLKGKIWVTDFFFTTCSTICPKMTNQMKRLNSKTADLADHVQFISFSINPDYDQPSVLKRYKENHGIKASNWTFLTGNEEETHALGVKNFLVHAAQEEAAQDGYAHSEAFTLVDKEGYVRGVYDVSRPDQVVQMERDIRKLLKYEYGIDSKK